MILKSKEKYKSIDNFDEIELPEFTVITGLNGSGKTHFLEAIVKQNIRIVSNDLSIKNIKMTNPKIFEPNKSTSSNKQILEQYTEQLLNNIKNFKNSSSERRNSQKIQLLGSENNARIIGIIETKANKKLELLTANDIFENYPDNFVVTNQAFFFQNLSNIFKRYQLLQTENEYQEHLYEKGKVTEINFLNDEEFVRKYGEPPWIYLNKLLSEAKLNYEAIIPKSTIIDEIYTFSLKNKNNGAEVDFIDLSSGEKVIISLSVTIFNSKHEMDLPQLILFDEPDASLHPSMTKQLLHVLQNIFVKDKHIKVIMTTHSPSTVALAPEESIYIMQTTGKRIEKISKDKAIKSLLAGVPSLSLNYENRKQVFVESKNDVCFYEKAYNKLNCNLISDISLNFISSGFGNDGDCNKVKEVVKTLRSHGNNTVLGIIDWDLKNNGNEFVKIPGNCKRYSIENYIFDPIILSAFLFMQRILDKDKLNLDFDLRYIEFSNLDQQKYQKVIDSLFDIISKKYPTNEKLELRKCKMINNIEVLVPEWFLEEHGHTLEVNLKEVFPELKKFQKEGELKKEIISKVIDDFPELLSVDILELFKEIQNS